MVATAGGSRPPTPSRSRSSSEKAVPLFVSGSPSSARPRLSTARYSSAVIGSIRISHFMARSGAEDMPPRLSGNLAGSRAAVPSTAGNPAAAADVSEQCVTRDHDAPRRFAVGGCGEQRGPRRPARLVVIDAGVQYRLQAALAFRRTARRETRVVERAARLRVLHLDRGARVIERLAGSVRQQARQG